MLLSLATPVEAAYRGGAYQAAQPRQVFWRPSQQVTRVTESRWRPVERGASRAPGATWQSGVAMRRSGPLQRWARNARPISRARDFDTQFRPDQRYDAAPQIGPQVVLPSQQTPLHSQFRPLEQSRQRTYEQIYGAQQALPTQPQQSLPHPQAMMPGVPYPVMPYMPAPVPYWPRW